MRFLHILVLLKWIFDFRYAAADIKKTRRFISVLMLYRY